MAISTPSLTAPLVDPVSGATLYANRNGVYPMHGTPPQYRFTSVNNVEWFLDVDNEIGTYTGTKQVFGGTTYYEATVFWPHQIRTGPFFAFFTFITTSETAWIKASDVKLTSPEADVAVSAAVKQKNIDDALKIAAGGSGGGVTTKPPQENGAPMPQNYIIIGSVIVLALSILYFFTRKNNKKNGNK